MADFNTALAPRPLGRFTLTALAAALALYLGRLFLQRIFLEATGFLPFDLQFPLRPQSIAIQLGAYAGSAVGRLYSVFAILDAALAIASACAVILVWLWLFSKQPNPLFSFLNRGGILLIPAVAGALDILENVGFYRLLRGLKGAAYTDTIEITATIYQVKAALIYVRDFLTILLVSVALVMFWVQRSRKTSA